MTVQVCNTAYRRTQLGEKVDNNEKLFSLFETHTQLYRRGKTGQPNQFGRLALIFEDGAGFISHYHLMARDATDESVVCEQTRIAQERHGGEIQDAAQLKHDRSPARWGALSLNCPGREVAVSSDHVWELDVEDAAGQREAMGTVVAAD